MNEPSPEIKPDLLKRLRRAFSELNNCPLVEVGEAYRLTGGSVRVPIRGFPIELVLGDNGKRLQMYPEYPLRIRGKAKPRRPNILIRDPGHSATAISGFIRLEPGHKLTLGRHDPRQQILFNYPDAVALRHLRLTHEGDAVVFKDKTSVGTYLAPLPNEEKTQRLSCLQRVLEIFGGPLKPLPKAEAMTLIEEVNRLMEQEACRARDSRGLPGGLLRLPAGPAPIVVADLHARVDNLLVILSRSGFLQALEQGKAYLVIIGDAVHSERDGELEQMDDSILIMDLIFRLKLRFPEHFFFLRGNHDSFSEEISKGGVPQGLLWRRALNKARGKDYRKAMQRYYDLLPYAVVSPDFCATHAAPPTRKISLDMLVEVHNHRGLIPELINNRMRRSSRPGGYTKGDVRRFRQALDLPPETPFIVGHTPIDRTGTYWLDIGGITNHHVLYSANETWVGAFTRIGGEMWPVKYPCERLLRLINGLAASTSKRKQRTKPDLARS